MTSSRARKGSKSRLSCVICSNRGDIERNHPCGRNHVAWFEMPVCLKHHDQFHALLRTAGINLESTPDSCERILRAMGGCLVALWMLVDSLRHEIAHRRK